MSNMEEASLDTTSQVLDRASQDTGVEGIDNTEKDTAGQDTAIQDNSVQATANKDGDESTGLDSEKQKTSVQEPSNEDTGPQDTGVEDVKPQDTSVQGEDTGPQDTSVQGEDTGPQVGEGEGSHDDDEWMLILGHERLKKKVIEKGDVNEPRPRPRDLVTVRVSGRLADETVVDHTDNLTFTIGDGDVVQALDLAISLMHVGEVAEVYTEAQYAYGHIGRKEDVPPDAAITYQVELLSQQAPLDIPSVPFTERVITGDRKRERGNYHYSRGDFPAAIHSYSRALEILSLEGSAKETDENVSLLTDLRIKCFGNTAAAQLKVEAWDSCISSCDQVLRVQPDNVKALFRKGKALASKGELDEAISSLRSALKHEPDSKIVHQEMSRLVHKRSALLDSEKTMYRRMIGNDKSQADDTPKTQSKWKMYTVGAVIAGMLSVGFSLYKSYHW